MCTINKILSKINEYTNNLTYDRKPQSLYESIEYILSLGGERVRPTLMLLSYNLLRDDPETILSPVCALETYHNCTLLHDNLMDDAPLRCGQQTIHMCWDVNTAILPGGSMPVLTFEGMAQCDGRHLSKVLRLFTVTALEISGGQQYDMEFENRNGVKEEEYIEMIRLKTNVLLARAMRIGAIFADAPAEDIENLYKFGEQVGFAFQLQDDHLDVYNDPKVFGKKAGGDAICSKKTYTLIDVSSKVNARQCKGLEKWIGCGNLNYEKKVVAVTELYDNIGVDKVATEYINYYFDKANKYIVTTNLPNEHRAELLVYAQRMLHRKW